MFNDVFLNKKVLITGHTGFKGSWLTLWLSELGAKIIGVSLDPYSEDDFFQKCHLTSRIIDIRENILNLDKMKAIIQTHQPEFVFHLAAQPIVRVSYDDPINTFQTNAIGTMNILEAIRQTDCVKAGVFITTDKVYANRELRKGYCEEDPLGGYDPYSSSKACAEIIIDSYRKSFFNPLNTNRDPDKIPRIASARAGNVLGGGDWQVDRLIPDCIKALIKDEPIKIRNPTSIRPWQHVIDALGGYLLLAEKLVSKDRDLFTSAWNFGPSEDALMSVENVVDKLLCSWKKGSCVNSASIKELKHEAGILTLDITKAITKLGWSPILTIDQCITFVVDWYREVVEHPRKSMYDFSLNQIKQYASISKKQHLNWMNYQGI